MATNRSRRLRKKLCVDEFQELGFELNLDFKQELDDKAIDVFLDAFLKEAMEANGLGYVGGDDFGLVCLSKRGSVSEEQRVAVEGSISFFVFGLVRACRQAGPCFTSSVW
ncbi:50S ribosome-binding protein YggL [Pseudomonas amygdali]